MENTLFGVFLEYINKLELIHAVYGQQSNAEFSSLKYLGLFICITPLSFAVPPFILLVTIRIKKNIGIFLHISRKVENSLFILQLSDGNILKLDGIPSKQF